MMPTVIENMKPIVEIGHLCVYCCIVFYFSLFKKIALMTVFCLKPQTVLTKDIISYKNLTKYYSPYYTWI